MSLHHLEDTITLPVNIRDAWDFFSNPNNLKEITPPKLGLVTDAGHAAEIYCGMIISYRVRPLLGIPLNWVTEITHVDPQRLFIDEQRFGPYRFWHHKHFFKDLGEGRTEIKDEVHYMLSGGIFGDLLNKLFVRREVEAIFEFRRKRLSELFGS